MIQNAPENFQTSYLPNSVSRWAEFDLYSAKSWVAELPEGDLRNRSVEQVIGRLADHDVGVAAEWLESLPTGPDKDMGVARFARDVVQIDLSAVLPRHGRA